jgi:hypothetical protein
MWRFAAAVLAVFATAVVATASAATDAPAGSQPALCGVVPIVNTHLTDDDIDVVSAHLQLLQRQGLFTSVVRLDLGGSTKAVTGADQVWAVASSGTVAVPSQRERLLSVGVQKLPAACESVVLFEDATVQFMDDAWVGLTVEALRSAEVVQPFSFLYNRRQGDSGVNGADFDNDVLAAATMGQQPGQVFYGAAYGYNLLRNFDMHRGVAVEKLRGYGGGAWAFRRSFLDAVGGVYERALWRGTCEGHILFRSGGRSVLGYFHVPIHRWNMCVCLCVCVWAERCDGDGWARCWF